MIGPSGGSGPGWYYKGKHYDAPQLLHEAMNAEIQRLELQYSELLKWVQEQAQSHHRIAVEYAQTNEDRLTTHNAMSHAYTTMAKEMEKRQQTEKRKCLHGGVFRGEKCAACGEDVR